MRQKTMVFRGGRADGHSFVRLGYGKYSRYIEGTISGNTSAIAVDIASDKDLTKQLLRARRRL